MNLKNLNSDLLVCNTKKLIREENRILSKLLEHMLEIEERKLYLEWGYGSLFTFTVKELGYSEASAQRRVEAMKFLKRTPQAKPLVDQGGINLSNLSLLERLSREAGASHDASLEALKFLESKVTSAAKGPSQAQDLEGKLRGHFNLPTKKRVIHIEVDEETYQLWLHTKEQLNERKDSKAIKQLCQAMTKTQVQRAQTKVRQSPKARFAGTVLRRELLKDADHQCEYVSPLTGKRCDNRHYLQCDHKVPYFQGGETVSKNMRVLCAQHNLASYRGLKRHRYP